MMEIAMKEELREEKTVEKDALGFFEFTFPSYKEGEFESKLKRVNKKLAKIKDSRPVEIVSREVWEGEFFIVVPEFGELAPIKVKRKMVTVKVTRPEITGIPGVTYLGTKGIKNGVRQVFNATDEYNLGDLPEQCDHCNVNRHRVKYFYFLNEKTGEILSLGSSCVNIYFGVDVESCLAISEKLRGLSVSDEPEDYFTGKMSRKYREYSIAALAPIVRYIGARNFCTWISREKAGFGEMSSGQQCENLYYDLYENRRTAAENSEIARVEAWWKENVTEDFSEKILVQLRENYRHLAGYTSNDFEYNLAQALFDHGELKSHTPAVGIACYALHTVVFPKKQAPKTKENGKKANLPVRKKRE
jgi:hypothetical protein